jgi:hypothetical protein
VAGEVVYAPLDLLEQIGDVLVVKGQRAAQESVEDDAAAPHIDFGAGVKLSRYHLLGKKIQTSQIHSQGKKFKLTSGAA